ncbi:MAG: hypothetical protein ACQGTM_15475 [bacterium]
MCHGSAIDEDAFPALAREASLFIDQLTFNRLNQGWAVTDVVKMATCAVAEAVKTNEAARTVAAGKKSESVGSWSVSYQSAAEISAAVNDAMADAATPYLIYTGLMDRVVAHIGSSA